MCGVHARQRLPGAARAGGAGRGGASYRNRLLMLMPMWLRRIASASSCAMLM